MNEWLGWVGTLGSVLITVIGFYMGWRRFQSESLRSRDVANWADRSIAMLVAVELCARPDSPVPADDRKKRLVDAHFTLSALTEQGRLFFRNVGERDGSRAGGTYEGRRPKLLDPLVVAFKAAGRLLTVPDANTAELHRLLVEQRKIFVGHVQSEIGRRQSASWESRRGGETSDLESLIASGKAA